MGVKKGVSEVNEVIGVNMIKKTLDRGGCRRFYFFFFFLWKYFP